MLDKYSMDIVQEIVSQAKKLGADLAGIARVADLNLSPSHRISERLPEFNGVGTKSVNGRKRGIVQWPDGAKSAIVIAIEHPPDRPELDWWVTGGSTRNTAGNRLLMTVIKKLADWLERELGVGSYKLPYHIEHGGIYMKDAAVMAGMGCIGKNNMLISPQYGPRQRLRVMLVDADLPSTGPIDFDPCIDCTIPCRDACPQKAFFKKVYNSEEYGIDELPGRTGVYSRIQCNLQMDIDFANFESVKIKEQNTAGKQIKYCRECELACPVGKV